MVHIRFKVITYKKVSLRHLEKHPVLNCRNRKIDANTTKTTLEKERNKYETEFVRKTPSKTRRVK